MQVCICTKMCVDYTHTHEQTYSTCSTVHGRDVFLILDIKAVEPSPNPCGAASPSSTSNAGASAFFASLKASLCVLFPVCWLQRAANVPVILSQHSRQYKVLNSPTFSGTCTRKFFTSSPMRRVYTFEALYSSESITLRGRRIARLLLIRLANFQ